jgi:hypothetical protein
MHVDGTPTCFFFIYPFSEKTNERFEYYIQLLPARISKTIRPRTVFP